jgi:hypothetical protein
MVTALWGQGSWWWGMAAADERNLELTARYADQIFGKGLFEVNTWTNKPTRIP